MEYFNNSFKKILGVVLIVGGMVGLFLPIVQGILMISTGALLLGNQKLIKKLQSFSIALRKTTKKLLRKFKKDG